jgi:outer membrane lipoprotein SlyB
VVLIEAIPRSAAAGAGGTSGAAVGSSGTGATGSSATLTEQVYRVTLRMDDGSTRMVTQETTPSYRSGDRVNLTGGVIQH